MNNTATDTPSSHAKLFVLVILIMGAIVAASFMMILRSRRTEPPPSSPSPTARLVAPQNGNALSG